MFSAIEEIQLNTVVIFLKKLFAAKIFFKLLSYYIYYHNMMVISLYIFNCDHVERKTTPTHTTTVLPLSSKQICVT